MIVDETKIHLKSGNGGNGCSSFQKKGSFKNIGWGGDGGRGGGVFFEVSPHFYDLSKFKNTKKFRAQDGGAGLPNNKTGKSAEDLYLKIPQGALIRNLQGNIIKDMAVEGEKYEVLRGGRGGKGNYRRDYASEGEQGRELDVILDYRIPNDVAILGFPNSGKTSLFNLLTGKQYKVAEYPFTTTSCIRSFFEHEFRRFSVLDFPALARNSDRGKGLGNDFLKHLLRTRIIFLLSANPEGLKEETEELKGQIEIFNKTFLKDKKIFYLLTKADKIDGEINSSFMPISVETGRNIDKLKEKIAKELFKK